MRFKSCGKRRVKPANVEMVCRLDIESAVCREENPGRSVAIAGAERSAGVGADALLLISNGGSRRDQEDPGSIRHAQRMPIYLSVYEPELR